jgi:NitT/TauT family transport system permease protein
MSAESAAPHLIRSSAILRVAGSQPFLVIAFFIVFVTTWQFAVRLLQIDAFVLPTPSAIADEFIDMVQTGAFWIDVRTTAVEMYAGYAIGGITALLMGLAIVQIRFVERMLLPYIVAFQAVPKTALAPVFLIWFGFGITSKIVTACLSAFFPILINVVVGLKAADRDQVAMLRSLDASSWQIFRYVKLPGAMPFIFAGLNIGVVFALIGAVVGEFVGAQAGLGYRILQMNYQFNIAGLFATMVALSVMGLVPYYILQFIQRRFVFWGDSSQMAVA